MRKWIILLGLLFASLNAFADSRTKGIVLEQVINVGRDSIMEVQSLNTLYTKSFSLKNVEELAIFYRATSDTIASVNIYLEQSFRLPNDEGFADEAWLPTHTIDTVLTTTAHVWRVATISTLTPLTYGRFKVVGQLTNGSTGAIEIRIGKQ